MAAHALVRAGKRVLMLERGGWVARGPDNWGPRGAAFVSSQYSKESPVRVHARWGSPDVGAVHCVGGQSVFYGGASFRFRERDFEHNTHIVGDSGAEWPFRYADIESAYSEAERLLGVAGDAPSDPTEPPRSAPFAHAPGPLAPSAQRIADAARRLGMQPSRIPLAISFERKAERPRCLRCGTCDGYACAAEAKNDIATSLIPSLIADGMTLRANTVCVRLLRTRSRVTGVAYVDRVTGERGTIDAGVVVMAAGTLATPHLLLASGFDTVSPAMDSVGRYLTRHCNTVVFGWYPDQPNAARVFDKQIAINDFYHGVDAPDAPAGPLGSLQQMTPPIGLVRASIPALLGGPAAIFLSHALGLLAMAEDQPNITNTVHLDRQVTDQFGLPGLVVHHRYSVRDRAANRALAMRARCILLESGALATWTLPIRTFSHALGTVRMGRDERTAPLDADGRFRGLDNLYVTDGSARPRSAGVNPSLTIAANALRIGTAIAGASTARTRSRGRRLLVHA
jgi:choline dehydrogenase-like flavoprotein